MNKKDVWLSATIVALAVMLSLTLIIILEQKKSADAIQEADKIAEIDRLLAQGVDLVAAEHIEVLARKDLSAVSYIRLLKRAWQLSRRTTTYDLFNTVAQSAHDAFPARSDLSALRVYGLIRGGSTEAAVDIYTDSEIETEKWPALTSEAGLYVDTGTIRAEDALSKNSKGEDFLSMYRKTGNSGFLLDALLLLLAHGEIQSAYSVAAGEADTGNLPAEFLFLLAFDAAKWQHAQAVLAEQPQLFNKAEYLFLKADVHMYQNRLYKAAELYKKLLELENEVQLKNSLRARALLNTLYIYNKLEEPVPRIVMNSVMDTSREDPEDSALLFAGYFLSKNKTARAQEVLDASAGGNQPSLLRQIIMEGSGQRVNPERYKSLLWRLVYRTEQEKYARYLAWFLIGIEDIQGLQSLIEHSTQTFGNHGWIQFYEAVVHMYSRNYLEAAEIFKSAFPEDSHWEYLYNAALSYSAANDITSALDELKAAETVVPEDFSGSAAVLAERVELLIQNGQLREARTHLSILEDRFPHNMNVGLLKSLLEARRAD